MKVKKRGKELVITIRSKDQSRPRAVLRWLFVLAGESGR